MKKERRKARSIAKVALDEILPEYDFSRARPNKYATRYASHGRAHEAGVELQENDPLDAEAIFTLGFNDEKTPQAFIAKIDSLAGVQSDHVLHARPRITHIFVSKAWGAGASLVY